MTDRFKIDCPVCAYGQNSKEKGGNKKCFHCDICWYDECTYEKKEVIDIIKKKLESLQ